MHGQIASRDMIVDWIHKFESSGSVTDMVHGVLTILLLKKTWTGKGNLSVQSRSLCLAAVSCPRRNEKELGA